MDPVRLESATRDFELFLSRGASLVPEPVYERDTRRSPASGCYAHPTTIQEFEAVYRDEYQQELESCDRWIKWCEKQGDTHGMNFHQGLRSAHVFNNIKMEQLLSVLKQERPNVNSGHNK